MQSTDSLPGDQKAVLQLVLGRGRSYDQIARMLSINPTAVRERALAALDALGPQTRVSDERRGLIADYLLGQLDESRLPEARDLLGRSAPERAWARVVSAELETLASGPLPEIPTGAAAAANPAGAATPPAADRGETAPAWGPSGGGDDADDRDEEPLTWGGSDAGEETARPGERDGGAAGRIAAVTGAGATAGAASDPDDGGRGRGSRRRRRERGGASGGRGAADGSAAPRSSRLGGLLLIALGVAIVAVVLVLVLSSGGSSPKRAASAPVASSTTTSTPSASASASASTTSAASSGAKVISQVNLTPPAGTASKIAGIAEVLKAGSSDEIAIVAQNVPPNSTKPPNAYAVWLYNSPSSAHILGFVNPGVGSTGRLSTAGPLPPNAAQYKQVIVTLETTAQPKVPGKIVLQGTLTGL